MHTLTFNC